MIKNAACCLSSLNLSEYVRNPYTDEAYFDYDEFNEGVCAGIRYLNHIIDINSSRHPLKEQAENSLNWRNIGEGIFGYGSALMKLGIRYGSKEAKQITEKIFKQMFRTAVQESSRLAVKFGSFPFYTDDVWESSIIKNHFSTNEIEVMRKQGLRNCSLLSIAPTGSLASVLNESSGAEPEFAISFTRRTVGLTDNQDHYYKVYCKAAKEYMELNNTEELPDYFVGASDINPMDRVDVQAIMQNHIDTAISSTINLPESATIEEMEAIYLRAWEKGLKGVTIFRDNCKKIGILTNIKKENTDKEKQENKIKLSAYSSEDNLPWGAVLSVDNDLIGMKRKIVNGCGTFHLQAFYDEEEGKIWETFINLGDGGGYRVASLI